jgi:hypothetical protein
MNNIRLRIILFFVVKNLLFFSLLFLSSLQLEHPHKTGLSISIVLAPEDSQPQEGLSATSISSWQWPHEQVSLDCCLKLI